MSFRLRLTLFFVLIVALPMGALAVLVSQVASDSADGKVDSRLSAGLRTASNLFEQAQADARAAAKRIAAEIANDPNAVATLQAGNAAELKALAETYAGFDGVQSVKLTDSDGSAASSGAARPIATSSVDLVAPESGKLGEVSVSTTTSSRYIQQVEETTGEDAALIGPRGPVSGTVDVEAGALPEGGEAANVSTSGDELRVAATDPLGAEEVRVALFAPAADEGFLASRPRIAIGLVVFFALALVAVGLILRSLQGYVREMLGAARRIGDGDFSQEVPVSGGDEMASLASEFNKMSGRLSEQMTELRRQRVEIEKSVRRVGEAFASGLDRQALLAILVETAVGTCEADYGLVALSGQVGAEAEAGSATEAVQEASLAAEQRALREAGPADVEQQGAFALASSLGRIGQTGTPVGVMTIARAGRPFNTGEREVFLYLVGQAAASVENVALHELVSEQAVTDDLTGLANNRAFREVMDKEAARAARFQHELSLLIVDIDDFKQVNDTYGHPQGDVVLRAIGRILDDESRGIDEPARYGGEEFVVALPETDAEGALELGERIRVRIEEEVVRLIDDDGEIRVTASVGVATLPEAATDVRELIAAADKALYEAKRSGKNRIVVAPENGTPWPRRGRRSTDQAAKGPADPRRK